MAQIKGTNQQARILGVTSKLKMKTSLGNFDPRQLYYLSSEVFELRKLSKKLFEKFDFFRHTCTYFVALSKDGDFSEDMMFGLIKTTEQKPKQVKIK